MLKLCPTDPDGALQCSVSTQSLSSSVTVFRAGGPAAACPVGRTSQSPIQKSSSRNFGSCLHGDTMASKASSTPAHRGCCLSNVKCLSATSDCGGTNKPFAAARV